MSPRVLLSVLLTCCIVGLAADRVARSQMRSPQAQAIPQLLDYALAELNLPQAMPAGRPLTTAVTLGGQAYLLDLAPVSIRAADFRLLVDNGDGELHEVEAPAPKTYAGTVAGVPGSTVRATLDNGKLTAAIALDEATVWHVDPISEFSSRPAAPSTHVVYREFDIAPPEGSCGVTDDFYPPGYEPHEAVNALGGGADGTTTTLIDLAVDADPAFYAENSFSVSQTMIDIETVINTAETIYETQLDAAFEITVIVVRTGADPYSSNNCDTLLSQFTSNWANLPEATIRRDIAQLFTGRNISFPDGCLGIAWLDSYCGSPSNFHYSVVESNGVSGSAARAAISAHEIGHNFSALHCCGSCSGCSGCRIMCPCISGCSGIITSFGTSAVNSISSALASGSCLLDIGPTLAFPFSEDWPSTIIDNDKWVWGADYGTLGFISTAADNEPSGPNSLRLDSNTGPYEDDEIRTNFIDLSGLSAGGVEFYTQHKGTESGDVLIVDYWSNFAWHELITIDGGGGDQTEFEPHQVNLDNQSPNPFHSEFRLRIHVDGDESNDDWYVDDITIDDFTPPNDLCADATSVPTGTTPFSTIFAATDGLALTCEQTFVPIINDLWYTWQADCTGTATFSTCNDADFDTRVAVYDANQSCPPSGALGCSDDGAGCGSTSETSIAVTSGNTYLVRVGGTNFDGGLGNLTISCQATGACPEDCDGSDDGIIGVDDFLAVLAQWGQTGTACDLGLGTPGVGVDEFLDILSKWGNCP